jgi:tetratricopeptide (TPR) repeat protein
MPAPSVDKGESLILIGDCLIIQERDNDALDYYHKSYLEYSNRRAPLYKMGEYFFTKKMWDRAIHYIEGLLHITNFDPDIDEPFHYKDGPYSILYIAYWWYGDIKKGKYYFDKALEINPYNPVYLRESQFHYRYVGNNIVGKLTFNETQFLYNESKKFNSVLEIKCENGRGTHALLSGCKGYVTVVTQKTENSEFLSNVGNYGNIKILEMSSDDAKIELNDEKFDMIFINGDNHEEIKREIMLWESQCKFLMCGYNYSTNKSDNWGFHESVEITGTEDHLWYKNMSDFHKYTVYKRK